MHTGAWYIEGGWVVTRQPCRFGHAARRDIYHEGKHQRVHRTGVWPAPYFFPLRGFIDQSLPFKRHTAHADLLASLFVAAFIGRVDDY